ncbi:MAG: efflux RND transporter periplasmic adaptor subunit [Terriglobales bacterium]
MTSPAPPLTQIPPSPPQRLGKDDSSALGRILRWVISLVVIFAVLWGGWVLLRGMNASGTAGVPTALVEHGQVRLQVFAQGTLKGGDADNLVGPSIASGQLTISYLLPAGALVQSGEEVVAFDTTQEHYNLTEAEEALEQAQQSVAEAEASTAAQTAADNYALVQARYNIQKAKLQVQQNPILAKVDAEQNNLTLASDQATLKQLEGDIASRKASNLATIAVQLAAEKKAEAEAATARADIGSMTLHATHSGYVAVELNQGFMRGFAGQAAQAFQIGDTVRHGQTVAEIPNTNTWQMVLEVNELDAGHLQPGQPAVINFVALPGRTYHGVVDSLASATGPVWDRQVECDVKVLDPTAALHPGLTAKVVVTTDVMNNVLHAPAQTVFNQGGQQVVYVRRNGEFAQVPVTVIGRSESQVVLQGVKQGDVLALSNPQNRATGGGGGPAAAKKSSPNGPSVGGARGGRRGGGHFGGRGGPSGGGGRGF